MNQLDVRKRYIRYEYFNNNILRFPLFFPGKKDEPVSYVIPTQPQSPSPGAPKDSPSKKGKTKEGKSAATPEPSSHVGYCNVHFCSIKLCHFSLTWCISNH